MTQVEELRDALEELMADKDSGPSDWATILVDQGWMKKTLADIKIETGTSVEVLYRGDWVPGWVTGVGGGGLVEVAHERGAFTAYAKGTNIRLPQKK